MEVTERMYIPTRGERLGLQVEVRAVLADRTTEFQRIQVVDTMALGRVLLLDGHVQLAEIDERAYHESLVHVPAMSVRPVRSALVVGGGDGGVLRELCRYDSVEHIDIVEIDVGVVDVCREVMPWVSDGAFDDPRVQLHIADAFAFVKSADREYDLIVVDCTDVYEEERTALSESLFTREFYDDLARVVRPDGFVVTQADNLVFCPYSLEEVREKFESAFDRVGQYWAIVPSFGGFSGFVWGSKTGRVDSEFDADRAPGGLRYLNDVTYRLGMGGVPFRSGAE